MSGIVTRQNPRGSVGAPWEFRDAVGQWARDHGRGGGDLVFIPSISTWQIRLSPMANDPRMALYQQGKVGWHELYETIELVEPRDPEEIKKSDNKNPYRPLDIEQLGIDGVLSLLDKGNMWSKRGDFDSLQQAVVAARVRRETMQEETRRTVRESVRDMFKEVRRVVLRIPYVTGGLDLKPPSETEQTP